MEPTKLSKLTSEAETRKLEKYMVPSTCNICQNYLEISCFTIQFFYDISNSDILQI